VSNTFAAVVEFRCVHSIRGLEECGGEEICSRPAALTIFLIPIN
jgi:hypothetical protein